MRPPRGGGRFGGGSRGGGGGRFGGGRGGGRGFGGRGGGGFRDEGPPSEVVEVSAFLHACEGLAVTKLTNDKIPYFNAAIYLQNMTKIGKVDEIFGPINESCFSVKMEEGIIATSYSPGDKFYIDPAKLLPLSRFLPQPKERHLRVEAEVVAEVEEGVAEVAGVVLVVDEVVAEVSVAEVLRGVVEEEAHVAVAVLGAVAEHRFAIFGLNLLSCLCIDGNSCRFGYAELDYNFQFQYWFCKAHNMYYSLGYKILLVHFSVSEELISHLLVKFSVSFEGLKCKSKRDYNIE